MNTAVMGAVFVLLATQVDAHRYREYEDSRGVPVAAERCCSLPAQSCCSKALKDGDPLRCDDIAEHRVAETIGCLETALFGSTPVNVTLLPCCDAYRDNEICFKSCVHVFTAPSIPPKRKLLLRLRCRSVASRATQCLNRCILWKMKDPEPFVSSDHPACTESAEEKTYFGEELGF